MEIIRNVIRDIKPEYWVALGAAVSILSLLVAGFSLIYVRRSAKPGSTDELDGLSVP
jgi:hypothetical protein